MDTIWIILLTVAGVLLAFGLLAAFAWWRINRSVKRQIVHRVSGLTFREKFVLAGELFTDHRVPGIARMVVVALVIYLALPLDLIPDFIPLLGVLDDVLVVFLGAGLILWWLPGGLLEEHITRIESQRAAWRGRTEPPRALPSPE